MCVYISYLLAMLGPKQGKSQRVGKSFFPGKMVVSELDPGPGSASLPRHRTLSL